MTIPLDLYGEVTTASGARFRWDANQPADSRPLNLSFRTKIGEGFSDAGLQLARRIDQDYPDLDLVNDVVFTGADGSTAYEGRVSAMPRDLSDRHSVGVTLAGWMAHAKDRRFAEVYVDRDVGQFGNAPVERRAGLITPGFTMASLGFTSEQGGMTFTVPNQALPNNEIVEAWYTAPPGVTVSSVGYRGTRTGTFTGFEAPTVFVPSTRAFGATVSSAALTLDDTLRTATLSPGGGWLILRAWLNAGPITPPGGTAQMFSKFAVYGNHGLAQVTGDPAEPPGILLSDILKNVAARYCPQLDTSGVQTNPYVVQHCAFRDRTYPYDAFLELNKYALWHLGVWDQKVLTYEPYDLTDYDWEIRTDDPGTTFSPQGPSTDSLFNGIEVTYTNPLTGVVDTLTPATTATLADASTANPWNAHGINHWDEITLSSPTIPSVAAQLGAAALADSNRPKTPGTITARGYIRDRAGNLQPCWKVRAGDTISITNFPNDTPRLIVETDYNDDDKSVRLAIDKPFALLDAYLDRQASALQAAGLT